MRWIHSLSLAVALGAGLALGVLAQAPGVADGDREVLETLEKLARAFGAGDAKAVAALWSEKAEYLSEDDGERLEGRAAIAADYAASLDKNAQARLEIDVGKVRRIAADVASVEGTARVLRPKQAPSRSKFLALLVRRQGAWLIDSVRESRLPEVDSNAEFLGELAWLNGTWTFKDDDTEVQLECSEIANGNFRAHRFTVKEKGEVTHQGTQVIGWDPSKKQLRSWVFASDGSFGDGVIDHQGKRFTIRVAGVLPDGEKSTATQVLTKKDDTHFTWEVRDRHVGARALPNVAEITLTKSATTAARED